MDGEGNIPADIGNPGMAGIPVHNEGRPEGQVVRPSQMISRRSWSVIFSQ